MRRPRASYVVTAAALLFIAVATLPPSFGPHEITTGRCFVLCGEVGLADFIVNIALYAPLGVGLVLLGVRAPIAIATALVLSTSIETFQIPLPRDASPGDVLANTLGATLGYGLTRTFPRWVRPRPREAGVLLTGWVVVFLGALATMGWLARPSYPRSVWYGQWMARFAFMEPYEGGVLDVRVGPLAVPSRRYDRSDALRAQLLAGGPVDVALVAGPPPAGPAPIFSIAATPRVRILMVGADRRNLFVTRRRRAHDIRLSAPTDRLEDAFLDVQPGDTVRVRAWESGADHCAAVGTHQRCRLGPTIGRGWAFLYWIARAPSAIHQCLDILWMALWFFPIGLWLRWGALPVASLMVSLAAVVVGPGLVGLTASGAAVYLGALTGLAGGAILAWASERVRVTAPRIRSESTTV